MTSDFFGNSVTRLTEMSDDLIPMSTVAEMFLALNPDKAESILSDTLGCLYNKNIDSSVKADLLCKVLTSRAHICLDFTPES